jgi:NADH-quinone oxidoreductase subunit K
MLSFLANPNSLSFLDQYLLVLPSGTQELVTLLVFTSAVYFLGLLGIVFNYKNFLVTMMSVELMYLGAVSSFVIYGTTANDPHSLMYALTLLILAACESAIGLGLLIVLYRFGRSIDFEAYQELGG